MHIRFAALALAVGFLLAGCSTTETGHASTGTSSPILVTKPGDYGADANASAALQPHLHDYWGGAQRLVVMEKGLPGEPGPGISAGASVMVHQFRPDSGNVVPQGAASVEVTLTWTDAQGDLYTAPELWYKTAAENETHKFGPIESGKPVTLTSTNAQNDLPHQLLSAWVFEFRLSEDPQTRMLRFKGDASAHVEAIRGLDIPIYPGHPDLWGGAEAIELLDVTHMLGYLQDPDSGCDGVAGCPEVHVPAQGKVVPYDAAYVEARLEVTYGSPTAIGLSYHSAAGRVFERVQPDSTDGKVRTYVLEVGMYGDGPYATASQWEFLPFIEGPVPDTVAVEEYHLTVTVHRA